MKNNGRIGHFDVDYGVASVAITAAGLLAICTTGASYHGIRIVASATQLTILVFDSASATSGNLLDVVRVSPGGNAYNDQFTPVLAKHGITIGVTGGLGKGVVFFSPKG